MQHLYRTLAITALFFCSQPFTAYGNGVVAVKDIIAATILPDGQVNVPASCFIVGEFCSVDEVLIEIFDGSPIGSQPPAGAGPSLALDCSHVGTQVANIWVRSALGVWTAYQAALFVQDNLDVCNGGGLPIETPSLQLHLGLAYGIDGIEPGGSYSVASTYFILHDQYLYCDQGSFTPANDDACNAISLPVGPAACPLVGANINATAQAGEPAPPDGDCDAQDAWCDGQGAENSVWFTFEAPTSVASISGPIISTPSWPCGKQTAAQASRPVTPSWWPPMMTPPAASAMRPPSKG